MDLKQTAELIPPQVSEIIGLLKEHTYTAHLAGECAAQLLRGEKPMDIDLITDAQMPRILAIFEEKYKVNTDFVQRGELIIILGGVGISISPYRSGFLPDGQPLYSKNIDDDLRRRVFSADAIALHEENGIYDPFGGIDCINGDEIVFRAVGEAEARQAEINEGKQKNLLPPPVIPAMEQNPQAVMRAIERFMQGGFTFGEYTLKNICDHPYLLKKLPDSGTRLPLCLIGKRAADALMMFAPVIFEFIPKLAEEYGYEQRSDRQEYTLYEHCAKAVGYAVPDQTVRLALLLHGIGKYDCEVVRSTHNTFFGHAERGAMLARDILTELGFPKEQTEDIFFLIQHHDDEINEQNLASFTAEYGAQRIRQLLLVQAANLRAKSPKRENELAAASLRALADGIGKASAERSRRNSVTLAGLKRLVDGMDKV